MLSLRSRFCLSRAIEFFKEDQELRARTSVIVTLILLGVFLLALPYLELLDSNDLVMVGQDFEIDILNVLTIFGICTVLLLRLLAFLPSFRTNLRALIRSFQVRLCVVCREVLIVLVLPDRLSGSLHDSLPLLI